MGETEQQVAIERRLPAEPELVWKMWTEGDLFASWYGPTGARVEVLELDPTPGGRRHIRMEMDTPDGPMQMYFAGEHLTVEAPDRLVYTEYMADESGAPQAVGGQVPPATEVEVLLRAVDGGTHMVMTHRGVPGDSPGAAGWTMAIDALEAALTDEA